jgi:hypothetical protein
MLQGRQLDSGGAHCRAGQEVQEQQAADSHQGHLVVPVASGLANHLVPTLGWGLSE